MLLCIRDTAASAFNELGLGWGNIGPMVEAGLSFIKGTLLREASSFLLVVCCDPHTLALFCLASFVRFVFQFSFPVVWVPFLYLPQLVRFGTLPVSDSDR